MICLTRKKSAISTIDPDMPSTSPMMSMDGDQPASTIWDENVISLREIV